MNKIRSTVGRGGRNVSSDVVVVQTLLNRHVIPPTKLLTVDGVVGPKTIGAIVAFQHRLGVEMCDGRVDPVGRTFLALLSMPKTVPVAPVLPSPLDHAFSTLANTAAEVAMSFKHKKKNPTLRFKTGPAVPIRPVGGEAIAWGAKVSVEFKRRVIEICRELDISADYLMSCMALETGESFRSDIKNPKRSATGLIQFLESTARDYGTSVQELATMTPVEQLEYVRLYFLRYKGRLRTLEDVYMRIICPAAVGKDPSETLYSSNDKNPKNYESNKAFDTRPKDGKITVEECSFVLRRKYNKGLQRGFYG